MRGRGRPISSVLTDALIGRHEARLPAVAAAFSEACGWPLAREVSCRAVTRDGRLIVVASSRGWANQVEALQRAICAKVNVRLGRDVAMGLEIRVGPLDR